MNYEPASDTQFNKLLSLISVNEILKDIYIEPSSPDAFALAKRYGYRPYIIERYLHILGYDETLELLKSFEEFRKRPAILCNYIRIECRYLKQRLADLGFAIEDITWCPHCFMVSSAPQAPTIGSTHEYLKGYYYVYRDRSSLIPPLILNPQPGSIALDLCAAPGGKSVHMLLLMNDQGLLIANDISTRRVISLLSHFIRMGLHSYVILNEDGIELPKKLKIKFDYVLVDAPCSAEGGIMFDPSRKTKTSIKGLAHLVEREIKLLLAGIELAKEGGRIVYTTCSIAPEENEYVITKVLQLVNHVKVEPPLFNYWSNGIQSFHRLEFEPSMRNCIRVWPHKHSMEGYFICSLRKL